MATLAAAAALIVACSGAPTAEPKAAATPGTTPAATITAVATSSPAPTVELGHPVGVVAFGHSGLTGEGTSGTFEPAPENSWATGSNSAVNSVYLRLVAVRPETEGHVANTAQGSAPAAILTQQAQAALKVVPAPMLAIISTLDNDIGCAGTNIASVGASIRKALDVIHAATPNTKILIVGQLGRPRIDFIRELVARYPGVKSDLMGSDACSFFGADGKLRPEGVAKLSAVIDRYEAEQARVCALVPNCATDGGVRKAYLDSLENFSADLNHLNVRGQAAEAALIWPVIEELLGL